MTASFARPLATSFDWRRVGAFSTSLAAHLAVLALILMPLAPPVVRTVQRAMEISWIETPPPAPQAPPPEVQPPPKPAHPATPRVPPTMPRQAPAPAAVDVPSIPVASPPAEPMTSSGGDVVPAAGIPGSVGETRQLAYDGALRLRYPAPSIRAREQGTVLLRVLVDAEGRVERIEVARSSGYPKLDAAAREAVQRGRFKPVLVAGKATATWGMVPIEFRLDRA